MIEELLQEVEEEADRHPMAVVLLDYFADLYEHRHDPADGLCRHQWLKQKYLERKIQAHQLWKVIRQSYGSSVHYGVPVYSERADSQRAQLLAEARDFRRIYRSETPCGTCEVCRVGTRTKVRNADGTAPKVDPRIFIPEPLFARI